MHPKHKHKKPSSLLRLRPRLATDKAKFGADAGEVVGAIASRPVVSDSITHIAKQAQRLEAGTCCLTMASNVWHTFMSLRFSGFKPYLEAGARWFTQVKEAMKVLVRVYNPLRSNEKTTSPQVRHKIKMASMHMSMDEVSKTYKITPIRRL